MRDSTSGAGAGAGGDVTDDGELTPPAHRRLAKSFSVSASRPRDKLPERSKYGVGGLVHADDL